MNEEEQKAWDGFAEAALTGILALNFCDVSHSILIENAANSADAMMEQRKARM